MALRMATFLLAIMASSVPRRENDCSSDGGDTAPVTFDSQIMNGQVDCGLHSIATPCGGATFVTWKFSGTPPKDEFPLFPPTDRAG